MDNIGHRCAKCQRRVHDGVDLARAPSMSPRGGRRRMIDGRLFFFADADDQADVETVADDAEIRTVPDNQANLIVPLQNVPFEVFRSRLRDIDTMIFDEIDDDVIEELVARRRDFIRDSTVINEPGAGWRERYILGDRRS